MSQDVKLKIGGDASGLIEAVRNAMAQIEKMTKPLSGMSMGMGGAPLGGGASANRGSPGAVRESRESLTLLQQILNELRRTNQQTHLTSLAQNRFTPVTGPAGRPISGGVRSGMGAGTVPGMIPPQQPQSAYGGGLQTFLGGVAPAAIMGAVTSIVTDFIKSPMAIQQLRGGAAAGTTGQQLSQMRSGQFAYESMYAPERKQAAGLATLDQGLTRFTDTIISKIPGINMVTERGRARLFNSEKYEAMMQSEWAENKNASLEGLKNQNVFNKDAIENLQANAPAYLNAQRTLGLNDKGLFSHLKSFTDAGFTSEQGMTATNEIMGAGGSTEMGLNSAMALKAKRGLNLNNATNIFGSLSNTMGGSETSKATLIDIFSTAQSIGLDKSKYAAENSKFIQNVAEVINQGSLTSKAGTTQVTEQMANFATGATTMKGLENAKAAYEAYKGSTSETSGFSGAINTATIMQKFPALLRAAGNDPRALQLLLKNKAMMDPGSPEFQGALLSANAGMPKNKQITAADLSAQFRSSGIESTKGKMQDQAGIIGDIAKEMTSFVGPGKFEMSDALKKRMLRAEGQLARVPGYEGFDTPKLRQSLLGMGAEEAQMNASPAVQGRISKMKKDMEEESTKQFESKETGRDLDAIIAASAEEAGTSLKTLAGILDTLTEATNNASAAATRHADEMRGLYETMNKLKADHAKPEAIQNQQNKINLAERHYQATGSNQTQANHP